MPKRKKKAIRKSKKKPGPSAKASSMAQLQPGRRNLGRSQSRNAGTVAVEVSAVEVVRGFSGIDETEATPEDSLDDFFPPEYGGSE